MAVACRSRRSPRHRDRTNIRPPRGDGLRYPMQDNPNTQGIGARHEAFDLRDWVSFAWRHWKFIAAITALVLVFGTAYLLNQTPLYTATAQVLLDPQKEKMPGGDVTSAEARLSLPAVDSQIAIIRSTVFLRRV